MYKKLLMLVAILTIVNALFADLRSAVDSLKFEIEKNPDDYVLHYKLGECYYRLDEYENALHEYARVLELDENNSSATNKIGLIYGAFGEYEKMRDVYKDYVEKEEKAILDQYYDFSRERGMAYAFLGEYGEAINHYLRSVTHYSGRLHRKDDIFELMMIYYKTGDTLQANKWLKEVMKDFSKYGESYTAVYYYLLGKFNEAHSLLYKSKKSRHFDIYNYGVFRITAGDPLGLDDIKRACIIDTTGFVQAVYDAIVAIKRDSLEKAEQSLRQKIPGLRRSGIAKGLLAWVLEKLGKDTQAKRYWFKCYGQLPLGTDVESMRSFVDKFIETISL